MNTKVLVVMKLAEDNVGDVANTHLESSAIRNKTSDMFTNTDFSIRRFSRVVFREGSIDINDVIEAVHVDKGVTVSSWHVGVDLSDDAFTSLNSRVGTSDFSSE
jgi:hypothetical protein